MCGPKVNHEYNYYVLLTMEIFDELIGITDWKSIIDNYKGDIKLQKIRKAVIPAAGFGTRFLPATKAMPKEMLPIVDKPAIQYIVEEILASGIQEILIISGHAKRAIEDHFDSSPELEQHLVESGKLKELEEI